MMELLLFLVITLELRGELAGHAVYIHCSCHRLQLASIQAAESVPQDLWNDDQPLEVVLLSSRVHKLKETGCFESTTFNT